MKDGLTAEKAQRAADMLASGSSIREVCEAIECGYMAMYKLATGATWKSITSGRRYIPLREATITPERREWAWRVKIKKGWTNAKIALKLGVSEMSVSRAINDEDALMQARVRRSFLLSGSHQQAIKKYGISTDTIRRLMEMPERQLPPRLKKHMEE
jgi:hypothetical protein